LNILWLNLVWLNCDVLDSSLVVLSLWKSLSSFWSHEVILEGSLWFLSLVDKDDENSLPEHQAKGAPESSEDHQSRDDHVD